MKEFMINRRQFISAAAAASTASLLAQQKYEWGGPVLDMNGKVVGVVASGLRGARVNFAIPVTHVTRFVDRPDILFTAPALTQWSSATPGSAIGAKIAIPSSSLATS